MEGHVGHCQLILLIIISSLCVSAQSPPSSDPQALAFASQSIAAMTGGATVSDVTLSGSVAWSVASDVQTGTATLKALGSGESRMDLMFPGGTRSEVRDASTGTPEGRWIAESGDTDLFASHNCMTDAAWFFPALGSLAGGPNVVLSYIGQESRNGGTVQHIQSYVYQPNWSGPSPTPQQLSTVDFYLDSSTLFPVAIGFNAHPDNDPSANIPVEIDFANYQNIGGVNVASQIQQFLQGTMALDITISSASFNTGIPISTFAIN